MADHVNALLVWILLGLKGLSSIQRRVEEGLSLGAILCLSVSVQVLISLLPDSESSGVLLKSLGLYR